MDAVDQGRADEAQVGPPFGCSPNALRWGVDVEIPCPRWATPLLQPSRYKAAYGGRGGGKSEFFVSEALDRMVRDPGFSVLAARQYQNSLAQSVKRTFELQIEKYNLGGFFEVQRSGILRRGGTGLVTFVGLADHTADSIKSYANYDVAFVEEAQSVSKMAWDLLRPTIRKPGSEIWAAWNPRNADDAVDAFFRREPVEGAVVVEVNYWDNPWFPDVLRAEMERDRARDLDTYLHVWCGHYEGRSNRRVFRNWRIEEFDAPADAHFRFGIDFGYAADPTAALRCFTVGRKLYIDHEIYGYRVESRDLPDFLLQLPEIEKWPSTADSSRPETISDLRAHGLPKITASIKGPKSVEEGIEWLRSFDIVVHPRCKHTIAELANYSYRVDENGRVLPKIEEGSDHLIDCARYSQEGARRMQRASRLVVTVPPPTIAHRW
jgi:phage terminase large subunit